MSRNKWIALWVFIIPCIVMAAVIPTDLLVKGTLESTGTLTVPRAVVDNIVIDGNGIDATGDLNLTSSTKVTVDNLEFEGNTINSGDTDGDINLSPDGTGTVVIDTDLDVDNLNIDGNTISSSDTDGDITIDADGSGELMLLDNITVGTEGSTTQTLGGASIQSALAIQNESATDLGGLSVERHVDSATFGAHIVNLKSRGDFNTQTVVQDDDVLSRFVITGHDGTDYEIAAEIRGVVNGTPGSNDMPGAIEFWTTQDGGTTLTQAGTIGADQSWSLLGLLDVQNTVQLGQTTTPSNPPASHNKLYTKSDNKLYILDSSGTETEIGSGGGGGGGLSNGEYNFFVSSSGNYLFEDDVTGWTGSTTAPTQETTDEIEGAGSLSWDPAGAETLRSDAITIPKWAYGKNCYAEVWYTGGDTDFELYVLDGSNTEIESTANDSTFTWAAESSGARRVPISFVCPTSGSVKLSLESGSDEPEIIIDRAYIGQNFNAGAFANQTNWITCTMTIGGSSSDPTKATSTDIDTCYYRRVGPNMEIIYNYAHTDNTGSAAGSGTYLFQIPDSKTIDTSVLAADTGGMNGLVESNCTAGSNTSNDRIGQCFVYDSTHIAMKNMQDSLAIVPVGSARNGLNSSSEIHYSIAATVPILEWSQTAQTYTTDQSDYGWTDYTPTFTGFGTVSTEDFRHRRVGDTIEIEGTWTCGTSTATEGRISLPGTLVSDSSIQTITIGGRYVRNNNGGATGTQKGGVVLKEPSVGYMTFTTNFYEVSDGNNANWTTKADGDEVCANSGDELSVKAEIQIDGWVTSNRAPQLVNSVVTNYEGVSPINAAKINCDSGAAITSQLGTWVSSVGNISAGACVVTLTTGVYGSTPYCWADDIGSNPNQVGANATSATSVTIDCDEDDATDCTSYDVDLFCLGAK